MRGDAHSNTSSGQLQQDSSSGSSSPHSNTSNDDEILEVTPPGAFTQIHNIYNFSIPDVIKHEPRLERHEINSERADCNIQRSVSSVRKRTCPVRLNDEPLENDQENDLPSSLAQKNKRRRVAAAENLIDDDEEDDEDDEDDDDDDADCHHRPPVIDLTNIEGHDDFTIALSDSEVQDSAHIETRPLHHATPHPSFNEVLSNLQRFRQQLEDSQERVHLFRSSRYNHRLRRRRNSRAIITDGPFVTDDMLTPTSESDVITAPEMTSADDSVMVINEVRGDGSMLFDDRDIALRMATDPTYSPPYAAANLSSENHRSHRYPSHREDSFQQFQDRIRHIRQRSRDRLEQVRRMSEQAQERLARIHESITSLHQGRRLEDATTNPADPPDRSGNNNNHGSSNNNSDNETTSNVEVFQEITGNTTSNTTSNPTSNNTSNDDVEIIRESNPTPRGAAAAAAGLNSNTTASTYLDHSLSFTPMAIRSSHNGRHAVPLPEFLRNSLINTLAPPRLHHLQDIPGYEDLWNLAERLGPAKPRGLNKSEIDQIPSFRFSATTARETNTKCVVCMGEYSNREKLRRLPCTHDFHSKCIDKWLRSNKTCPVCRDEVKIEPNKPYTP